MKEKKTKKDSIKNPSMSADNGQPENSYEYVNFYGTYNIQPTQMSENTYPAIAQGLDSEMKNRLNKESERWKAEERKNKKN